MNKNIYLDYNQISLKIKGITNDLLNESFDSIVMILRGGAFLGIHVAYDTGLPFYSLKYIREENRPIWESNKPEIGKVLLCEDFAGSGRTLIDCKEFLENQGYQVKTLVICKDTYSASIPDFYCFETTDRNKRFILPWERYRLMNIKTKDKEDHEYIKTGWDMDGVFLDDVDGHIYAENLENALSMRDKLKIASYAPQINFDDVIITGRPLMDETRTKEWLRAYNIANKVCLRDDGIEKPNSFTTAMWKGFKALEEGCTHYVESDAEQAIHIANHYPEITVTWWNKGNPIRLQASY